jgi:hypothetical protein
MMQGRVVPQYSQEFKVQEALHRAGVSHNAGIVAQLDNVLVRSNGIVYFCYSRLTKAAELAPGDGGVVPDRIVLEGNWEFPAPGYYDLRNTRITVNGAITISREDETEMVPVREIADWG